MFQNDNEMWNVLVTAKDAREPAISRFFKKNSETRSRVIMDFLKFP